MFSTTQSAGGSVPFPSHYLETHAKKSNGMETLISRRKPKTCLLITRDEDLGIIYVCWICREECKVGRQQKRCMNCDVYVHVYKTGKGVDAQDGWKERKTSSKDVHM